MNWKLDDFYIWMSLGVKLNPTTAIYMVRDDFNKSRYTRKTAIEKNWKSLDLTRGAYATSGVHANDINTNLLCTKLIKTWQSANNGRR